MDALDLIVLCRRLTKVAQEAIRGGGASALPAGHAMVLRDVFAHPESSVGDISARTGLAQSIVSKALASFEDQGKVELRVDPEDGRRTLARISAGHLDEIRRKGSIRVDALLADALGEADQSAVSDIIHCLESLSTRLAPAQPGPVVRQLRAKRSD